MLLAFLAFVFLTGGGSRADIQSLPLLRPVAVIMCAVAIFGLRSEHLRKFRAELLIFAFCFVLILAHAIPLPPALWKALPGHELLAEADAIAGLGEVWRPASVMPETTWNAFYAMFVPFAVFLLLIGLPVRQQRWILPVLLGFCGLSAALGILQAIGPPGGPLYFYKVHSRGLAIGLFANRNHAAFFLAMVFPMLAVLVMQAKTDNDYRLRFWLSLVAGASVAFVILVAGSRLGLGLALLNIAASLALFRRPPNLRHRRGQDRRYLPLAAIGGLVLAVGLASFALARTTAINRLIDEAATGDLRFAIWKPTIDAAMAFLPFGSGIGSYAEAFEIFEPNALLGPEYINHAHNDYLELFMTGGVPAVLAVLVGLLMLARQSVRAWQNLGARDSDGLFAALGSIIVSSLLLGSLFDYPLRTPILASVFVIGVIWLRSEKLGATRKRS